MNQYLIGSLSFFSVFSVLILPNSSISAQPKQVTESFLAQQPTVPSTAEDFFYRGVEKFQKKDYQGAIKDFDQALLINPDFAEAYNNRGNARAGLGDYREASISIRSRIARTTSAVKIFSEIEKINRTVSLLRLFRYFIDIALLPFLEKVSAQKTKHRTGNLNFRLLSAYYLSFSLSRTEITYCSLA